MAGHEVPKVIVFSHDADLTLRVLEYPQPLKPNDDGGDKMKSTTDFQVDRQVLINTFDSEFSRTLLTSNAWAESGKSLVTLKEHNPASVEAILCSVYSKGQTWKSSSNGQHTTARTLQLPAKTLWDVIASNHLFMKSFPDIDAWFSAWYGDNEQATTDEMLLHPRYQFHHARGFMSVTRNLVYDRPFIEEYMNEKHYRFHLPPRLIQFSDEHEDYWNHVLYDKQWDKHCRIKHGQTTWYSSFVGRADTRDRLLKRKREYDSDDA
ncbi:hypothetical protein KCU77_g2986, partial [Aureobasidium melanogenum]